jgi:7-carboxy-7-deazaguanine synthase
MKDKLVVSEKFYSIQGEGQTMGIPSVFVRLAGCNLLCKSSSWVCDSIEVWQKGVPVMFDQLLTEDEVHRLATGAHLIFTGGEPLLHQKKVAKYIAWFESRYFFKPIIEVETNGTIVPLLDMMKCVNYWNCSPKLANSGEPYDRRVKPEAIRAINSYDKTIFKFVIFDEKDLQTVLDDFGDYIDREKIVLMPAGETQEKLEKTRPLVAGICIDHCLRYSDRLHIVIWNLKTGV